MNTYNLTDSYPIDYDFIAHIHSKEFQFPSEAFEILYKNGMFELPRFRQTSGHNEGHGNETQIILNDLIAIGSGDLAVGRIYEGHINALLLIDVYGTLEQKQRYFDDAANGKIFGIWNTERSFEAVTYKEVSEGIEFEGAKTFCSGSLNISRPIITASGPEGKKMFVLEMEHFKDLQEDTSLWKPLGMEATVSHRIDFTNCKVLSRQVLGIAGDYDKNPYLSYGAIRFAAVLLGCAHAIAKITLKHLKKLERESNASQNLRISELGILLQNGHFWFQHCPDLVEGKKCLSQVNYANMLRTDISRICELILSIAEKAIGVQGMLKPHPFERKFRDLKVYLKQPNPDLALESIGHYYAQYGF